ncbi:MAG: hypothetical protein HW380_1970 [Magnetococcales bacterium]|nr:hypothetical protein [Magnetococcales bacterium]
MRPDFADAHFNEGVVWLTRGDFDRGWRGYEWRMGMAKYRDHHALHPISAVTGIAGRSFLVFCEQGFGDDIQFIRYVGWLREAGARVVVACPGELARLFVTVAGVDHWVVDNDIPPACDYQVLLLSLPLLFGARMGEFPASVPYLSANPERMDVFRQRLEGGEGVFKVGLVWRGNPKHFHDRHRSMSPALFSRLKQLEGVYLIGLQKGATHEELAVFAGDRFLDLGGELHDFADTAAVVAQLDLVIAVDTSVAHLAGALGRPVWVLLPAVADWRWLLGREDSPWYPTMRLWRQSSLGDWSTVMDKVVEQLQSVIQSFAGCGGTTLLSHVNSL